jgi:hypothetical protein
MTTYEYARLSSREQDYSTQEATLEPLTASTSA